MSKKLYFGPWTCLKKSVRTFSFAKDEYILSDVYTRPTLFPKTIQYSGCQLQLGYGKIYCTDTHCFTHDPMAASALEERFKYGPLEVLQTYVDEHTVKNAFKPFFEDATVIFISQEKFDKLGILL